MTVYLHSRFRFKPNLYVVIKVAFVPFWNGYITENSCFMKLYSVFSKNNVVLFSSSVYYCIIMLSSISIL